ncbi:MAG TPA: glycosyl hydrolase family 28-related protein [Chthoniobacteraceae bacterium]|nr:glycosyl hydrolase family 28-related protein [Chthoniobacteraceae bacterium]
MTRHLLLPFLFIAMPLSAQTPSTTASMSPTPRPAFPQHESPGATREPVPDFEPEFDRDSPTVAAYRHRELNVLEFGAKADGGSHPLSANFPTQEAIDARYGKGRYRSDDETDFVAIMEAIRHAREAALEVRSKTARGLPTIYLPHGEYRINRTLPIIDINGFTLRGDGKQQTRLTFTGREEALFGIERSATIAFSGMEVASKLGAGATAFLVADTLAKHPGRPTYHIDWTAVQVREFDVGVKTTGWAMTDSLNFLNCRFNSCQTALWLDNHQSLGHHFTNCYFGFSTRHLASLPPDGYPIVFRVNQGGNLTMTGGYIIIHDGVTLLLEPKNERLSFSPINWSSGLYNFYGVRWEQVRKNHPVLFDAVDDGRFTARVHFDNCVVYQRAEAEGGAVGRLTAGMNVVLRNVGFNKEDAYIEEAAAKNDGKRRGLLILDNVSGLNYRAEGPPRHHVEIRGSAGPLFTP